jgi:hypothetical protein
VVSRGVAGSTSWVVRIQPYVDAWAASATLENVVTEALSHDDRAWEAYERERENGVPGCD